jgi:hypothetical protein
MYGLVNKAIEELVTRNFGEEKWEAIKEKAKVSEEVFISSESYPDQMTYQLVGAATEILQLPADKILHAFGEFWVLSTAKENYGELLRSGGRDLPEFLNNLPNFHARILLFMPKLRPPEFRVLQQNERSVLMGYYSPRGGLAHFTAGLFSGIAKLFEVHATVTHTAQKSEAFDHDEFLIEWE